MLVLVCLFGLKMLIRFMLSWCWCRLYLLLLVLIVMFGCCCWMCWEFGCVEFFFFFGY